MEKTSCSCGFGIDPSDLFCRKCGKDCDPKWKKESVYATVLTCECCGDGADKGCCQACGAFPTRMTEAEFRNYCASVEKESKEISKKEFALRMKKGAINRLEHNLRNPDGPECNCCGMVIACRYHSEQYD